MTNATLPNPTAQDRTGTYRPASTGATFGAWAAIYAAPVERAGDDIRRARQILADMDMSALEM